MAKSWRNKLKLKQDIKEEIILPRMDLGEGYYIQYKELSNGFGGYHNVNMNLYDPEGNLVKEITDRYGYFIDFPGTVEGDWRKKLNGGLEEAIEFASWVYKFKQGFALFSWTVQPDGRYWADEDGFGMENDEEVVLYSYMNKQGEFVTPFSDFSTSGQLESLEAFKTRTGSFIWNSLPEEFDLWVSPSAKKKVDYQGKYREFFGNTVVFPLEDEVLNYIDTIQQKLEKIRENFKYNQPEAYLADALKKETYHITLHDLINGPDIETIEDQIQYTEKKVLYILNKLKEMEYPLIKMEPVCMYNMNSTSVVLGFQAVSEEDHQNLMMLYQLFQTVVDLSYPLTPHVTLSYFRYGKHKSEKLSDLRVLIQEINAQIDAEKKEGRGLVIELDVKKLVYQRFSSMNHYFEN